MIVQIILYHFILIVPCKTPILGRKSFFVLNIPCEIVEQRQRGSLASFISQMPHQFNLFEQRQRGSLTSVFQHATPI